MYRDCKALIAMMAAVGTMTFAPTVAGHGDSRAKPRKASNSKRESTGFGRTGDPASVSRTIDVGMDDTMHFTPGDIVVQRGATIRFNVSNHGKLMHEGGGNGMKRLLGVLLLLAPLSAGAQSMPEGEVRKVDKDAGKLTLKHGPIPNLDMPPMTMVFRVKDAAMLVALKPGDKVNFQAEKQGGQYVVTKIVPVKIGGFLDAGQPAPGRLREHLGGTFA